MKVFILVWWWIASDVSANSPNYPFASYDECTAAGDVIADRSTGGIKYVCLLSTVPPHG